MKRFTETNKWRDPWFWNLSTKAKLLFLWLLDNCDNAGVIEIDVKLLSGLVGEPINEKHITELGDRLQRISDRKWILTKFIRFQFGELRPTSIIHRSVISLLRFHGLPEDGSFNGKINPMAIPRPSHTQSHQEKDTDKEKVQDKEKGVSGDSKPTLEEVRLYCAKSGIVESDADWFYFKCEGNGWTNNGKPIRKWGATLISWKNGKYLPSQKQSVNGSGNHPANLILKQKALDRVEERLKSIKGQFPLQKGDPKIQEYTDLKVERLKLMNELQLKA